MADVSQSGRRHVTAPQQTPAGSAPQPNQVSVTLGENEDVEWIWSAAPGGGSYVSGYNIIRRDRAGIFQDPCLRPG